MGDRMDEASCPEVEMCPIRATVRVLDGKYKAVVLWHLHGGTMRFGEIGRTLPEATPRMLSKQLRELEDDGLVTRTEYSLTEEGRSIIPVISAMYDWGSSHMEKKV